MLSSAGRVAPQLHRCALADFCVISHTRKKVNGLIGLPDPR